MRNETPNEETCGVRELAPAVFDRGLPRSIRACRMDPAARPGKPGRRTAAASRRTPHVSILGGWLLHDGGDVAPFSGEDEIAQRFALAIAGFLVAQASFGKRVRIARIADGESGDRFEIRGD